jgi:hypothetical protein
MPGIDNYLLVNYGLDGPSSVNYQDVTPATIDDVLTNIPSLQTGIFRTIAIFPAGTKLISLHPTSSSTSQLGYRVNTDASTQAILALVDAKGVQWQIAGIASNLQGVSLMAVRITEQSAESVYSSGDRTIGASAAWNFSSFAKPASFDMDTPMSLCICVTVNSATSSYVRTTLRSFRVVSM